MSFPTQNRKTENAKTSMTFITVDDLLNETLTSGQRLVVERRAQQHILAATLRYAQVKIDRPHFIEHKVALIHSRTHQSPLDDSDGEFRLRVKRVDSPSGQLRIQRLELKNRKPIATSKRRF